MGLGPVKVGISGYSMINHPFWGTPIMENGWFHRLIAWTPHNGQVAPRTVPKFQHPRPVLYSVAEDASRRVVPHHWVRLKQEHTPCKMDGHIMTYQGIDSGNLVYYMSYYVILCHIYDNHGWTYYDISIWYTISTATCLSKARVPVQRVSLAPRSCRCWLGTWITWLMIEHISIQIMSTTCRSMKKTL